MKCRVEKTINIDTEELLKGYKLLSDKKVINKVIRSNVWFWGQMRLVESGWPERDELEGFIINLLIEDGIIEEIS